MSGPQQQQRLSVTREDYGVSIDIEIVDGQAECVAIARLESYPPLTGAQLRRLPLAKLVREAIANTGWGSKTAPNPPPTTARSRRRKPSSLSAEQLEQLNEVAAAYREARMLRTSTRQAVMKKLLVGSTKASRLIAQARAEGIMGKAIPRKAAEVYEKAGAGVSRPKGSGVRG